MPITQRQAANLANHLHDLRQTWTVPSLMSLMRNHRDHPAPFPDIAHALCTAARDDKTNTPGLAFQDPRFWPRTAPDRPAQRTCPAHPDDPLPGTNCSACRSDYLLGQRPSEYLGRIYPPLDGPEPA